MWFELDLQVGWAGAVHSTIVNWAQILDVAAQEFVFLNNVHLFHPDADWVKTGPLLHRIYHRLLSLCDVELQVIRF